jgi:hypothetical protein
VLIMTTFLTELFCRPRPGCTGPIRTALAAIETFDGRSRPDFQLRPADFPRHPRTGFRL